MSPIENQNQNEALALSLRRRIARAAFLAFLLSLPVILIYQVALPVAGIFGDEFPELLRDKCIRMILVVACFVSAAFACNVDRFSENRLNRFTAAFTFFFLVHLGFTIWVACYPNLTHRFGQGAAMLQYYWMLGSYGCGLVTWWIVRQKEQRRKSSTVKAKTSQFTIGSILTWISLTGLMITVLRTWAFVGVLDHGLDPNASIVVVVCAILCALFILPLTLWLIGTRRFLLVALGHWVICFAASCFVFAVIGLADSGYDWRDGYISTIAAFSLAVAAFLFWLQSMRVILNPWLTKEGIGSDPPHLISRFVTGTFAIVAVALWSLIGFWGISNFGTVSKERSFAAFDTSPLIMQQLEDAYGVETMSRVREKHDPQKLHEWLNFLSRDLVPKEQDVIFQLGRFSKLEHLDRPEGDGLYRKLMGFSKKEVALLPDETVVTWVNNNRIEPEGDDSVFYDDDVADYLARISNESFAWQIPYAPWDQESMPLASKYCRDKQSVLQQIRETIRSCESGTFPEFEHGLFISDEIPKFAADLLFADARFAISEGNLPRTFENLECVSRLAKLNYPNNAWSFSSERFRARAMGVLIHLADVKQLGESEVNRIKELAVDLNTPIFESKVNRARNFARLMLEHRGNMAIGKSGKNYLMLDRKLESCLIAAFPQTVQWPSYIEARKHRFDDIFAMLSDIQSTPSRISRIYKYATSEADLEQPFHRHLRDLVQTPKTRAERLGATDFGYERSILRLNILFSVRAKLRNVALELLIYRVANGEYAPSLKELDCDVEDPFSGQSFIYRIRGDRFDLYSVGGNKVDDNGDQIFDGDIVFEWPARTLDEFLENY